MIMVIGFSGYAAAAQAGSSASRTQHRQPFIGTSSARIISRMKTIKVFIATSSLKHGLAVLFGHDCAELACIAGAVCCLPSHECSDAGKLGAETGEAECAGCPADQSGQAFPGHRRAACRHLVRRL